jgi:O-antigen ligase
VEKESGDWELIMAKLVFSIMVVILFGVAPFFIRQRRLYFIGLACSLYVFSSGWIFYHFNGIMLGDIPIFALLIMAVTSNRKLNFIMKPIGIPVLCMMGAFLISAIGAVRPGWVFSETTKYLRMYLLMIGLAANIRTVRELRVAVTGMLIGLLFEVLLGIYQWRIGALGIWYLGERPAGKITWRSMGTFFVPSFYANYLAMILPVSYRLFAFYRASSKRWTFFYSALFFLALVALYTTFGRGPWIGFLLAMLLMVVISVFKSRFKSHVRWTIPIFIVFVLLFMARYGNSMMTQFTSSRRASTEIRFPQFRIAWRMIKANPISGVGLGNYEQKSFDYMTAAEQRDPYAQVMGMMVHNIYLFITAESGFLGGICLLSWIISMFVVCYRILFAKVVHDYIINVTMGIFGGIFAIAVIFTFSPDIHAYQILYQLGLFCGILYAMNRMTREALYQRKQKHMARLVRRDGTIRSESWDDQ